MRADDALRLRGVATPKRGLGASLAALVLLSLVCSGSASATGIGFPDDPVLSDPSLTRLELGPEYLFTASPPQVDIGWTNSAGDTLTFDLEVSFLGEDQEFVPSEFMVVFTSIRRGNQASVTCGDLSAGGALPFAPYEFVDDSATGAVVRQVTPTDSPFLGESQVCNAEDAGAPWFGLVFDVTSPDPLQFSFQIAITLDDLFIDENNQLDGIMLLKQAYAAPVPEPSTALLVLCGLVGLVVRHRGTL